jgi:sugar-phosphatase
MVTAESISRGKPDPEAYLKGAAELGVAPADCLVVEDAPAGAAAARSAGMRLLGLATTHRAEELEPAELVVPDLTHVTVRVVGDKLEVSRL